MLLSTIKVLELQGSYYEMGKMQGEAFSSEIRDAMDDLIKLPSLKEKKPPLLPRVLYKKILMKKAWPYFEKYISYIEDVKERFNGLVKGSGQTFEYVAFLHMGEVILNRVSYTTPIDACTAVAVLPSMAGKTLIMKNFDYPPSIIKYNLLRKSVPSQGIPSIELTKTPVAIAHDGMNEEGLVVLYNYAASIYPAQEGPFIGALVQHVLNNARNVKEAVEIIMQYPFSPSAGLILIADKKEAIVVEISPKRKTIRYPVDGLYVVNTNHYQTAEMQSDQIPVDAVFKGGYFKGRRILESSFARYERAVELLKNGISEIDDIFNIARDHGKDNIPSNNTICRHGEPVSSTITAAVFVPEDGRVYYIGGNPCQGSYSVMSL